MAIRLLNRYVCDSCGRKHASYDFCETLVCSSCGGLLAYQAKTMAEIQDALGWLKCTGCRENVVPEGHGIQQCPVCGGTEFATPRSVKPKEEKHADD